ncbi:MAG: sugar transferase [Muribaculaceae bacterium]|nr:sugar transferase [Muribaculaceae bacterium]
MNTQRNIRILYICSDYVAAIAGLIIFSLCRYMFLPELPARYGTFWEFLGAGGVMKTLLLFPPFALLIDYLTGYYIRVVNKSRVDEVLRTLSSVAIATLAYFFVALLNDRMPMRRLHYELILMFAISQFITTWSLRYLITSMLKRHARGERPRRYIMVCRREDETRSRRWISETVADSGFEVVDICHSEDSDETERIPARIASGEIEGVVVAPSALDSEGMQRLLHTLYTLDVPVLVSPDDRAIAMGTVTRFDHVVGEPLVDIVRPVLPDAMVAVKRFSDVVLSAVALTLTSPLILVLGMAVKIGSPGPMFYSQERIGYRRRPFMIHKLRSMINESETDGPRLSADYDPRITPVGRFMRKYRLDELPNLWNVLVGEMSLVGPRPEREHFIRQIVERAPHYTLLHLVRPGLTSWGMVRYGYASNVDEMVERLRYDILYVQNLSLEVDVKILLYTLRTVLRGEGK